MIRGERERSPPLPEIMQSRFPHLGNSHGSATASVQWLSLAMGEPPSWSWYLPCQVSMSCTRSGGLNDAHACSPGERLQSIRRCLDFNKHCRPPVTRWQANLKSAWWKHNERKPGGPSYRHATERILFSFLNNRIVVARWCLMKRQSLAARWTIKVVRPRSFKWVR